MKYTIAAMLMVATCAGRAPGRNVDLSTIPPRDSVQLTIYNSEDLTLVRETRTISFKKGDNPLQFSWANTLIDPTSVDLRFVTHAGELELMDTTFPHEKPQMLYWSVRSTFEGDAQVEITYFTSGISWSADYVCVSDPAEEKLRFEGFVRIINNSGEDYPDAGVRLVVGTINLVEKIQDLARRGLVDRGQVESALAEGGKYKDLPAAPRAAVAMEMKRGMSAGRGGDAAKQIVKEGLSEYFIFTVPGTETVENGWSKRMRLFQGLSVPFRVQYRYRPQEYGNQLVRLFLLRNDTASKLGESPLPDGIVRLLRDNGHDGLSALVQQTIKYIPVGQEIELNLGGDPEVIHEYIRMRSGRSNLWFRRGGVDVYFNPQQGHKIEVNDTVAGWDDEQTWVERVRNYRTKAIDVEIRRSFSGHVVFRSALSPTLHDFRTPQFAARIEAGQKQDLAYDLTYHQGYNKKQDNVTLEAR